MSLSWPAKTVPAPQALASLSVARDREKMGVDLFGIGQPRQRQREQLEQSVLNSPDMALQPCRSCLIRTRQASRLLAPLARTYSSESTPESFKISETPAESTAPRWSQTPPAMKAPIQLDFAKKASNKVWKVNNDPARLDDMYNKLLGPGGSKMLPEELKWLAVTHKSFDQGRRGFNDRLALMGEHHYADPTYAMRTAANRLRTSNACHGGYEGNCQQWAGLGLARRRRIR